MISFKNSEALEKFNIKMDLESALKALQTLKQGSGAGNEFTGWTYLPSNFDKEEFARIKDLGKKIYNEADALVVIGIGGSYLGAKAAIEFLLSSRYNEVLRKGPKIYFVGNGLNSEELSQVATLVGGKNFYVNVISKSGTTLEPAASFRFFKSFVEEMYGKEEAKSRIICTTDKSKGMLKNIADKEGYQCFVVPDNIGGRYSVLTAVGLLPIASAGIDIDEIMEGALLSSQRCLAEDQNNPALLYAATRQALYKNHGKKIEVLSLQGESLRFTGEWWKQLFGESEGKDGTGIFPASCVYTADLHSMGQYIQDGERIVFETFLTFKQSTESVIIKSLENDIDKLNYLDGKSLEDIYTCAKEGVKKAHEGGGVPCLEIELEKLDAKNFGELIYFFEAACAISGYMQGVNPFNQPGVEEYKKNMFTLLGRN